MEHLPCYLARVCEIQHRVDNVLYVDTPLHKNDPKDALKTLQPMGKMADGIKANSFFGIFNCQLARHRI